MKNGFILLKNEQFGMRSFPEFEDRKEKTRESKKIFEFRKILSKIRVTQNKKSILKRVYQKRKKSVSN
jgi:hypothetical protein